MNIRDLAGPSILGALVLAAIAAASPQEAEPAGTTSELVPLVQFDPEQRYKGMTGGLYGDNRNNPPDDHLAQAVERALRVRPLDAAGRPDDNGRVVLLSLGMSNTSQSFSRVVARVQRDAELSPHLLLVDGAQSGQVANNWGDPAERRQGQPDPWEVLYRRLEAAGVTSQQVQAVWMKHARAGPQRLGEFPAHAEAMAQDITRILNRLAAEFPNLQIVYLSSRTYAGYATTPLNPEPYAYESAFVVRWLIERQIAGRPELNHDPQRGPVTAPLLLWGPYLWAAGTEPNPDGLFYVREDYGPDGTHPSDIGRQKIAERILHFFKTDPTARPWTLRGD